MAILLVLGCTPGALIPGGELGVDLFFVLSGFLITAILVSEWNRHGHVSLLRFYQRRALRLLPALVFMAWIVVICGGSLTGALIGLSYTGNVFWASLPAEFIHLWSLAAEEQFYLLWPPVLVWVLARRMRPRNLALALLALFVAAIAWRTGLLLGGASKERLWFLPDTHADPLLVGCLAGVCFSYRLLRVPKAATLVCLVVAVAIVATLSWESRWFFLAMPVFAITAAAIVLSVATSPHRR